MRAVTFNVTIPSYLVGKSLGKLTEAAVYGGLSGVRYTDVSEPELPGDDWVKLDILKAGICGSDRLCDASRLGSASPWTLGSRAWSAAIWANGSVPHVGSALPRPVRGRGKTARR